MMGYTTVVTGASRGIGRAIAERLAREGHFVINLSRTHPENDFLGTSYSVDLGDDRALATTLQILTSRHSVDNLVWPQLVRQARAFSPRQRPHGP